MSLKKIVVVAAMVVGAQALIAEVGWNQTDRDWRMFLDLGHVQAVRTDTGRVIATAATLTAKAGPSTGV